MFYGDVLLDTETLRPPHPPHKEERSQIEGGFYFLVYKTKTNNNNKNIDRKEIINKLTLFTPTQKVSPEAFLSHSGHISGCLSSYILVLVVVNNHSSKWWIG